MSRSVNDESAGGGVDVVWVTSHNGSQGGLDMARSYRDSTAARRARVAPGVGADRAVFEQAYDVAMQVVELREKHGLTQAQLAELSGIDQGDISRTDRGPQSPPATPPPRAAAAPA